MDNSMEVLYKNTVNPRNPKILAIGKNYVKHVKEMGGDEPPSEPVIFQKPFSSVYYCPGDGPHEYVLPTHHSHEIHHEIELGIMIGREGKNIKQQDWKSYIGGYFLGLDLTDRELQAHLKQQRFPWDLSKGQDGFLPMSSFIPHIEEPQNVDLLLKINDKVVQSDSTSSMYYKIPFLLEFLSQNMTLYPGDLILTGTPHGVGPIRSGDKVRGSLIENNKPLACLNLDIQ